jgi:hypothetical protein
LTVLGFVSGLHALPLEPYFLSFLLLGIFQIFRYFSGYHFCPGKMRIASDCYPSTYAFFVTRKTSVPPYSAFLFPDSILGLELSAYTLSHSTSFFVKGFFEMGF